MTDPPRYLVLVQAGGVLGLFLAALVLAGCSAVPGPVQAGDSVTVTGIRALPGQKVAFGDNLIRNSGRAVLTLKAASLHAEGDLAPGVDVLETWAMGASVSQFAVGVWTLPTHRHRSS